MTATETLPQANSPSYRPCPNCADSLTGPQCANCGWEPGLVPVALTQTADGPVTTFAAEKRHRFMLAFGVLSCVFGVGILGETISSGGRRYRRRDHLRPAGLCCRSRDTQEHPRRQGVVGIVGEGKGPGRARADRRRISRAVHHPDTPVLRRDDENVHRRVAWMTAMPRPGNI